MGNAKMRLLRQRDLCFSRKYVSGKPSLFNGNAVSTGPILLAGDSNLHRIADAIPDKMPFDCLPVSGARFTSDVKSFSLLLKKKLQSTAYGQVYLHLGSNDVLAAEDRFYRKVADLCDLVHLESPTAEVVLCEVLPRSTDTRRWKKGPQDVQSLNRWISRANHLLQDLGRNIPYVRYMKYLGFSKAKDQYLARDGLHLNREGAQMCFDAIAADSDRSDVLLEVAKQEQCCDPDDENEWPCLPTLNSPIPELEHEERQLYSTIVQESPPVKEKPRIANDVIKTVLRKPGRRRVPKRWHRKSRKSQYRKKSTRKSLVSTSKPTNGIWVSAMDGVGVFVKYGNIHSNHLISKHQQDEKKEKPKKWPDNITKKKTKKFKVEWLSCPDCPVRCSREDFLLTHMALKHSAKGDQSKEDNENFLGIKTDLRNEDDNCQQPHNEEKSTVDREIWYCEGEYHVFPPSVWRGLNNIMIIGILCGEQGLFQIVQKLLIQQLVDTNRQHLLMSGDVEQNPGPTYQCKWDICGHSSNTFPELKLHIAEHVHKDRQCKWKDCTGCTSDFDQQVEHAVHHVYQTEEYFPTLEDWHAILSSGKLTQRTNLQCCPKHLRSKLQMLLLDEDFEMRCNPYTVQMHTDYLIRLSIQEKEFGEMKNQFIKKREGLGEDWSSCMDISSTTAASASTSDTLPNVQIRKQNDFQFGIVQTDRPELSTSSNLGTILTPLSKKRKQPEATSTYTPWFINLTDNLSVCEEAINLQKLFLNVIFQQSLVTSNKQSFLKLEQEAARLASVKNCTNGSFVCTVFRYNFNDKDIFYTRYVESGIYRGFMKQKYLSQLKEKYNVTNDNIFLHNVITTEDINEMSNEHEKDNQKRNRPDKIYNRSLKVTIPLEVENLKTIEQCSDMQLESYIVHLLPLKSKTSVDSKDNLYLEMSDGGISEMKKTLIDFRLHKLDCPFVQTKDLITELSENPKNLLEQTSILNCLSGDPKRNSHLFKRHARFESNFMVNSYDTTSLRLKTFDLFLKRNMDELFAFYKMYFPDLNEQASLDLSQTLNEGLVAQPPKKRKTNKSFKKFTITKERIEHQILPSDKNSEEDSTTDINIYDNFCCSLLDNGKLSIQHFDEEDGLIVCTMNDYSSTDGSFRQHEFVHTLREKQETGDYLLCSCSVYRTLINLNAKDKIVESDYIVLDSEGANCVTCIHCKFLKEKVIPALESNNVCKSRINKLILKAKQDIGKRIVEISANNDTHKYSIFTGDDDRPSFVHFSYNKRINNHLISCLNGKCISLRGHKRSISTLLSSSVCKHLTVFKEHPEYWQHLVEKANATSTSGLPRVNDVDISSINNNDTDNSSSIIEKVITFDEESGLWKFKCKSKHSPLNKDSLNYRENVLRRDTWNDSSLIRLSDGCLKGQNLVSDIPDTPCDCGAGWTKQDNNGRIDGITVHDKSRVLTVYTMIAPVKCDIHIRLCISNQCILYWDEGKKDALHVLSRDTAAGDEIGWEFVSMVINSGCTFSSYCQIKNEAYKLRNSTAKFMDPTTFINWWFSWAANMNIDFRIPCDVCGFEPKRLCCDGTKVGVGFRHALFDEISKPCNEDNVQQTIHRRMDRCFLKNLDRKNKQEVIQHRETLNYVAKRVIGELSNNEIIDEDDLNVRINSLKAVLPDDVRPSFDRFFVMNDSEKIAFAYVLKMLSTTASVTSFLPPSFCPLLQLLVNNPQTESFNTIISQMRAYAPELRDLICESMMCNHNNLPNDVRLFIQYLINESLVLESNIPENSVPQAGTYNPAKFGRAYYFNKTGNKLRNIRKYTIDLDKKAKNNIDHDDIPLDFERCQKLYSKVQTSAPGTSTLFLWFCADHGHCYGFHMTGAEGRKDPSASLYSYLEKPPTDIFYDFACNLQEYCLNRESGYYKNVRFFHDIFHSYSHKCSTAFRSSRLQGFESINSEICEQFNSFIQCIKKSARQMSQEHFCFYLQFFLNEWNKKKRLLVKKKMQIALASLG